MGVEVAEHVDDGEEAAADIETDVEVAVELLASSCPIAMRFTFFASIGSGRRVEVHCGFERR